MSRVFLAQEVRLGRQVVVKVLPPELAAGVSAERFEREIRLAAALQHPHIVPLLTAGSQGDLLYYVMPHIAGESLRARIAHERELPVGDTVRILRDVCDALAYAHGHGIVHRDVKPDNVLLSGKHALVTDFGVAKAVASSSGGGTLTSLGMALGTPAYMAPEQAAGDPTVDHRADLYAVGALGYELLAGRPPFSGLSPQGMLAAQVTTTPDPVTRHRDSVPPALAALIMRCLAKHPADRPQSAEELLGQLEAMATPTGGTLPEQTTVSSGTAAALRRSHPVRVAALFGLAAVGVLALARLLVRLLGPSLAEALRVDLAQSRVVRLLDAAAVGQALGRMGKRPGMALDVALARELAEREGAKAVVHGQIAAVGRGYVLSAELVSAPDGATLVALREDAKDDGAIIAAVDRLSARLRERIGESLRAIRASEPLEQVTTGSLEALRKYSQALKANDAGQFARAVSLVEEAISLDTTFAMAYRKLAVVLTNTDAAPSRIAEAAAKAFRHRDRLTPLERYLAEGFYYYRAEFDLSKVESAYRSALELDPENYVALNNLALALTTTRRFAEAESLTLRGIAVVPNATLYVNATQAQIGQGKLAEAARTVESFAGKAPQNPVAFYLRAGLAAARRDFDSAEAIVRAEAQLVPDPAIQEQTAYVLGHLSLVRGRLADAERHLHTARALSEQRRLPGRYVGYAVALAMIELRYRNAADAARDRKSTR